MTYTLWSHGDLLGESELDYVRVIPHLRTGDLHLTEKGLVVAERLSQTRADGYHAARRVTEKEGEFHESDMKTLRADLTSLNDQYGALALELRAPNGSVIPTEDIYLTDTEYLLAIAGDRDEEDDLPAEASPDDAGDDDRLAELEHQCPDFEEDSSPWLEEVPVRALARFQISVALMDQWAIP